MKCLEKKKCSNEVYKIVEYLEMLKDSLEDDGLNLKSILLLFGTFQI